MIGEWFVVSQLMAHPALRRSLRTGLTDAQATRVLSFLARAADHTEDASQLFEEFAAGSIRRQILAAVQAAMAGEAGRRLLDAVVAKQIRSAEGWTLDQLNELEHLIPRQALLLVHVTIADLTITLYRQLAADNPAAYRADLAMALNNLGDLLGDLGRYQDALAAAEEAVALRRALAVNNPTYQADLATALNNLGNRLHDHGRDLAHHRAMGRLGPRRLYHGAAAHQMGRHA